MTRSHCASETAPIFRRDVEKLVTDTDARVVDQHIDAIHQSDRLGECGFHLHQIGDVGNDCRS